ncbi:hypothetical protein [Phytohabitans kaempferiae]|uniref:Uncharacterized protein n=1 Tax=Phytohabitans kaempferiae TaxID=1620943 RepID=A0ABV6ME70_9ACTN
MTADGLPAVAVQIGAGVLSAPEHRDWPPARSYRDTIARIGRLCAASGITAQHELVGARATRANVRATLAASIAGLDPYGLLVLTFAGHSERGPRDAGWCLYDGVLPLADVGNSLTALPGTAGAIVVADTCYAAALARFAKVSCTLVILAACAEHQVMLDRPRTEFVERLEQAVSPGGRRNPDCVSYAWLKERIQEATPDVERPQVWTNRSAAWHLRPFELLSTAHLQESRRRIPRRDASLS